MTVVDILCIALGAVGIFSTIFSLYADKERKEKVKKLSNIIQRKSNTIDSLEQENAFLQTIAGNHKEWLDTLINTPKKELPSELLD